MLQEAARVRIALRVTEGLAELAEAARALPVEIVACEDDAATAAAIGSCDALVTSGSNFTVAVAEALRGAQSRVRWVQFAAAGTDAAARLGIPDGVVLTNAAAAFAPIVAEHAMALLLAGFRRIVEADRARATDAWSRTALLPRLESVEGATLAIAGYGHIGRELARRASAFAMRPVVVTRRPEIAAADGVAAHPLGDLASVLATADAVVLAVALTPETAGLLGRRELAAMRASAWLVNVARGEVVDEPALIEALRARRIAGAALDVFAVEPLPMSSPLRTMDNVIVTPHVGGFGSKAVRERMAAIVAENIRGFAAGEPLRNVVARVSAVASVRIA